MYECACGMVLRLSEHVKWLRVQVCMWNGMVTCISVHVEWLRVRVCMWNGYVHDSACEMVTKYVHITHSNANTHTLIHTRSYTI